MSDATARGMKKGVRTLLQTVAGGGLTAVVAAVADGLSPEVASILTIGFATLVAYLQNYLEMTGTVPVLLPAQHVEDSTENEVK